jgi:hypothetical protein
MNFRNISLELILDSLDYYFLRERSDGIPIPFLIDFSKKIQSLEALTIK